MSSAWRRNGLTPSLIGQPAEDWKGDLRYGAEFPNVNDHGRADRFKIRVAEFQPHPAADEARFQHRPAPRGPVDGNRHRFGTKDRVAGNQRLVPAFIEDLV